MFAVGVLERLLNCSENSLRLFLTDLSAAQIAEQRSHDIMWKWEQQQKSSFFKQSKKSFPMFPYIEEKTRVCFSLILFSGIFMALESCSSFVVNIIQ